MNIYYLFLNIYYCIYWTLKYHCIHIITKVICNICICRKFTFVDRLKPGCRKAKAIVAQHSRRNQIEASTESWMKKVMLSFVGFWCWPWCFLLVFIASLSTFACGPKRTGLVSHASQLTSKHNLPAVVVWNHLATETVYVRKSLCPEFWCGSLQCISWHHGKNWINKKVLKLKR